MTDNETKKALEEISHNENLKQLSGIPKVAEHTLDLINRLEAEVSRLRSMNQAKLDTIHDLQEENNWYNETLNTTKVEAVKEFAEIVKANKHKLFNYIYSSRGFDEQIDNLVKEIRREKKDA